MFERSNGFSVWLLISIRSRRISKVRTRTHPVVRAAVTFAELDIQPKPTFASSSTLQLLQIDPFEAIDWWRSHGASEVAPPTRIACCSNSSKFVSRLAILLAICPSARLDDPINFYCLQRELCFSFLPKFYTIVTMDHWTHKFYEQ